MNKFAKVLSSFAIVGSLVLAPTTSSYAATKTKPKVSAIQTLNQQAYNVALNFRAKTLTMQKYFTQYIMNPDHELSVTAMNTALTIGNPNDYLKYKNTKYWPMIIQGGTLITTYGKLIVEFDNINQLDTQGGDVSTMQEASRQDAGTILNSLTKFNQEAAKVGIKPIPTNAYDPEMLN